MIFRQTIRTNKRFSKVIGYQIRIPNVCNNPLGSILEIKNPFTIATESIKNLGGNIIRDGHILHVRNCKALLMGTKKDSNKRTLPYCEGTYLFSAKI